MLLKSKHLLAALSVSFCALMMVGCDDGEQVQEEVNTGLDPNAQAPAPEPEPAPAATTYNPETVFFGFDDYTLNGQSQGQLQALADHLKTNTAAVVQIEGHCDERGSIEYNLALGEKRAQSVKNYLVQLGVDPARLSTISYGEEKPSTDGHDESAWAQNRRAEFTLTSN